MRRFQLLYEMWHLACNFVILAQLMDIKLDLHIPNRNAEKRVTRHNKRYCERNVIWSAVFEIKWRYDPRTCWTIWAIVSWTWKNSGDSTGFEPMTSTMQLQCSNQLSYEVTQFRAGQFVGLMFSRERNLVWEKCYMKFVWNELKIWSSHVLDNLSNCLMNLKNSGDSTGFEPMTSAMLVQCYNQLSYEVTPLTARQFVGLMFSRWVTWIFQVHETIA